MADDKSEIEAKEEQTRRCAEAKKLTNFGPINEKNIEQIRKLNISVLPVRYNDKFYTDLATSPIPDFNQIAFFTDIPVGNICQKRPLRGTQIQALYHDDLRS